MFAVTRLPLVPDLGGELRTGLTYLAAAVSLIIASVYSAAVLQGLRWCLRAFIAWERRHFWCARLTLILACACNPSRWAAGRVRAEVASFVADLKEAAGVAVEGNVEFNPLSEVVDRLYEEALAI